MKQLLAMGLCLFLIHSAQAQSLITFTSGDFDGGSIKVNFTGGGVLTGTFSGDNFKLESTFTGGVPVIPTSNESAEDISIPSEFSLDQNYPNPFNPSTNISYTIARPAAISIQVYNSIGALVATINQGTQVPGSYTATFDASHLATGLYIYALSVDNQVLSSKKMLLIK